MMCKVQNVLLPVSSFPAGHQRKKQLTCNVKVFWNVGGGEGEEEVAEVQKKSELTSLPNISLSE